MIHPEKLVVLEYRTVVLITVFLLAKFFIGM